jgi:hypothetical protein
VTDTDAYAGALEGENADHPVRAIHRWRDLNVRRSAKPIVLVASYVLLGAILLVSRLAGLGRSYWFDEITSARDFVSAGPGGIVFGPYIPNNHELFSLLAWGTASTVGASEAAVRLWSVLPFLAGAALVTVWLHTRLTPLSGLLFLFLATVSPMLLDVSRQARGYGLAFCAMSVLMVAALEADRNGRTLAIAATCFGGVVGTLTLPHFGIAFAATAAVLSADPGLRKRTLIGLGVSILAIAAWYSPHIGQIHTAATVERGFHISTAWLITAPIDQVVLPGLLWIEGVGLIAGPLWLPLVLLAVLVMASSPLARQRQPALILCAGIVATIVVFWFARIYLFPRFFSYLLVPSFILLATGASAILSRAARRRAPLRTVVVLVVMVLLAVNFASLAPDIVRLPREANRDAAEVIETTSSPDTPVLAYVLLPEGLAFYLTRPVSVLHASTVVRRVCGARRRVVYVMQPMAIKLVDVPCLDRPGTRHYQLEQYARGERIDVWLVPPRA